MSYTDDAVLAKLSAVNESHDSISSSAQWILFHRRHAARTVELWLNRLKTSSSTKRLSLIYLANELAQQSKIRQKMDFIEAFTPVIAEAVSVAYKGAPSEIQGKIKRVVDVLRDRRVFEDPIQEAIDSRIADLDKLRGAPSSFGASPFATSSPAIPPELGTVFTSHHSLTKSLGSTKTTVGTAEQDYARMMDPTTPVPSPPVYAARLNGLLKVLNAAEGATGESVKARRELVQSLERLLEENRTELASEEKQLAELSSRKAEVEAKKDEVESAIMRGISTTDIQGSPMEGPSVSPPPPAEPDRPEVEALTPPPMSEEPELPDNSAPAYPPVSAPQGTAFPHHPAAPGIEMLSNLASQYQSLPVTANASKKRRRSDSDEGFPDLGGDDGIDADVAEMLRNDQRRK